MNLPYFVRTLRLTSSALRMKKMHLWFFAASCALLAISAQAQTPAVSAGRIERHEQFPSQFVSARNVDVWLPEGYSPRKKYAVLYMHDGQMLFDGAGTWNKQEWQVDEIAGKLLAEGKIRDCIVVGIWNGGQGRHTEYFPQKPFEQLSAQEKELVFSAVRSNGQQVFNSDLLQSDKYLKFLTTELKPFIDKQYATRKDRKNTFIAGSSMGGLISMYAICEYPKVFGGAACISTHWPGIFAIENNPVPGAFLQYLKTHLPDPKTHLMYFDHGDQTLDALYPPYQAQADVILKAGGYGVKNLLSQAFPGEDHSERAWAGRLHIPLVFLLGR